MDETYTCPHCGAVSHNPKDKTEGYCGACHRYDADPPPRRYSWTQPICERCFLNRSPGRQPVQVIGSDLETCVECGQGTWVGIFIRVDPKTAQYPTRLKD